MSPFWFKVFTAKTFFEVLAMCIEHRPFAPPFASFIKYFHSLL